MELLLNEASEHSFIYDAYGNMLSATDGLGIRTEYAYDSVLHQYPVQATTILKMKKRMVILIFAFMTVLCFADEVSELYKIEAVDCKVYDIKRQFFISECNYLGYENYAYEYILDKEIGFDKLEYYPIWMYGKESFFIMGNQKFSYLTDGYDSEYYLDKVYLLQYDEKKYLVLYNKAASLFKNHGFIFDITEPEKVKFYHFTDYSPLDIYSDRLNRVFFGRFEGQLCFFVRVCRDTYTEGYDIVPYTIKNDSLEELIGIHGESLRKFKEYDGW